MWSIFCMASAIQIFRHKYLVFCPRTESWDWDQHNRDTSCEFSVCNPTINFLDLDPIFCHLDFIFLSFCEYVSRPT